MDKKFIDGRVSVIVPVYNAERYISEALDSILNQTYRDIEIIIVDDQSKDKSSKIISKHLKNHSNIIYFLQPSNLGAGASRNRALELATGEFVAFLDSDDIWSPVKIEKQLKLMKNKNTPFSYTAIEMIDDKGQLIKSKRNVKEKCNYRYLLHNTIIATSSVVINRNILGDFRMSLRRGGQDYATWLVLLRNGVEAYGINEALVKYRITNNSLSSNKVKSIKQVWDIQRKNEKLGVIVTSFNVIAFIFNALKKYLF